MGRRRITDKSSDKVLRGRVDIWVGKMDYEERHGIRASESLKRLSSMRLRELEWLMFQPLAHPQWNVYLNAARDELEDRGLL